MKKDIILFDLDNTIVNSLDYWYDVIDKQTFKKFNLKVDKRMKQERVGLGNYEMAEVFIKITNLNISPEDVINYWNERMQYYYTNKIKLIKGVKNYLEYLKNKGYKLVIVTATEKYLVEEALKNFNLDSYFDEIFTETTLGYAKNNEKFYTKLLEKLYVEPKEVFLFEDSVASLISASKFNIDSCGIIHKFNCKKKQFLNGICKLTIKNYCDKKLKNLL